ncbi:hypothetical protein D9M72_529540 [compost metagenome]
MIHILACKPIGQCASCFQPLPEVVTRRRIDRQVPDAAVQQRRWSAADTLPAVDLGMRVVHDEVKGPIECLEQRDRRHEAGKAPAGNCDLGKGGASLLLRRMGGQKRHGSAPFLLYARRRPRAPSERAASALSTKTIEYCPRNQDPFGTGAAPCSGVIAIRIRWRDTDPIGWIIFSHVIYKLNGHFWPLMWIPLFSGGYFNSQSQ